ncbi:MAG: hypothetical protein ACM32O_16285 [Clostridia bacterium]
MYQKKAAICCRICLFNERRKSFYEIRMLLSARVRGSDGILCRFGHSDGDDDGGGDEQL